MKNLNLFFFKLIIIFSLSFVTFISYKQIKKIKFYSNENERLILNLSNCFDLENKNSRRISESLKLVEYCMKKYGQVR